MYNAKIAHLASRAGRGGGCSGRIHDKLCPAAAAAMPVLLRALDCPFCWLWGV